MGTPKPEPTAAEGLAAYRRWQKREDAHDAKVWGDWQDRTIANADPECDALIRALEQEWCKAEGR